MLSCARVQLRADQAATCKQASRRSSCCAAPALLRRTAAGAAAALLAAQAALPALAAPDLALGATVFENNCAVCHQGGLNNIAGEEKHTLRRDAMTKYGFTSVEPIIKQVKVGKEAMPPFEGVLGEDEIQAVAAFVLYQAFNDKW